MKTDVQVAGAVRTLQLRIDAVNTASFPTGIDWNMDGQIDSSPVRAPVNWANTSCAAPYMRSNWSVSRGASFGFPISFWSDLTTTPEMYTGNGQTIAIAQGDAGNCSSQPGQGSCTRWTQRSVLAVPSTTPIQSHLAVAGPLVVFRSGTKLAYVRRVALPQPQPLPTRGFQAAPVSPGGPSITGHPAAISNPGSHITRVYAISAGRLSRWEYDDGVNQWTTQGVPEIWEDGTPVNTTLGIAVTHGADSNGSGIFAAIPNTDGVAAGSPFPVELARLVNTTATFNFTILGIPISITVNVDSWRKLIPAANRPTTIARPGFAYTPFGPSNVNVGRFYLTFVGTDNIARVMFTQGNRIAASGSRRLVWMVNQQTPFTDADNQGRATPGGVALTRFGLSVVGAASSINSISYFPAVDGIYNLPFHDVDERPFVMNNLRCSLSDCDD